MGKGFGLHRRWMGGYPRRGPDSRADTYKRVYKLNGHLLNNRRKEAEATAGKCTRLPFAIMRKLILDLCGGTGAWSKPYRDAGYDVEVITLPAYDVTKVVFSDHAIEFLRLDMDYLDSRTVLYDDVYGILAAPPCTEFSLAKAGAPRDFESGVEVLQACLKIIWQCRIHTKLAFWALENPVGFMRQFMGRPHFTYEHWQFGDMQIKPTDIWGVF